MVEETLRTPTPPVCRPSENRKDFQIKSPAFEGKRRRNFCHLFVTPFWYREGTKGNEVERTAVEMTVDLLQVVVISQWTVFLSRGRSSSHKNVGLSDHVRQAFVFLVVESDLVRLSPKRAIRTGRRSRKSGENPSAPHSGPVLLMITSSHLSPRLL